MAYATEDIIRKLKEAREAKGLSQRDLGAHIGVPESHISKIESGRSDIRLSSQIEFARALDLDLMLVPRAAVPAVEGVVRSTIPPSAPSGLINAAMAVRGLDRTLDAADRAQALFLNISSSDIRVLLTVRKTKKGEDWDDYQIILRGSSSESFLSAEIKGAC